MAATQKKEELKNQDTVQEQKNSVQSVMRRMRANTITLGADLVEVREQAGKPILDKETKQPKLDENGFPLNWPSKYYAKFTFMGGEVETEVSEAKYSELVNNINMPYYLEGRLAKVRSFGSEIVAPVFTSFELLA